MGQNLTEAVALVQNFTRAVAALVQNLTKAEAALVQNFTEAAAALVQNWTELKWWEPHEIVYETDSAEERRQRKYHLILRTNICSRKL